jgi:hypothetical protein
LHDAASMTISLESRRKTLEDASLYFYDLAHALPEHGWLLEISASLKHEAAALAASARAVESGMENADSHPRPLTARKFRRWVVALEGRIYGREGGAKCLISEMSENGLKAATGLDCRVGEELVVAWRFEEDDASFKVTGVVRYQTPDGTGIEFLNIGRTDRLRIKLHCEQARRPRRAAAAAGRK